MDQTIESEILFNSKQNNFLVNLYNKYVRKRTIKTRGIFVILSFHSPS